VTGFTIFWLDKGIDTGPILFQKEVAVAPEDTAGTLYFNKLFPMGVEAIGEAVNLIKAGNPPRIVQDESQATYDPPCGDEHAKIDWSKPAQQVYNLIRGCDPQPGAHTTHNGKTVRIFDARLLAGNPSAAPANVINVGTEDISIALAGGTLIVKRMRGEGGKVSAAEFAKQGKLKVGDRLI
jgi:methionyl-tRNA formyltransferase